MFNQWLINLGNFFTPATFLGLGISFLAGILASVSPCILPLIPITLGIVGATSATTKLRGFLISFSFVLGLSVVYTILGIVSSFFGVLLGTLFVNSTTYIILAVIFFLLSAISFGLIKINLPLSLGCTYKAKGSLISVFILGMISAFAFIPCNFPVLGAILSFISVKQNIVYGAIALFLFSLGQCTLLIVVGTFTGLIQKLPKQGLWLIIIKKILSATLALVGVYFIIRFIQMLG
ncbi:MAG: hypothetical protein KAS05_04215 [Candidatus Omnitrophica bacterium]|nr:hypothetical protein [Candidatus Omnitrophota bacterium]